MSVLNVVESGRASLHLSLFSSLLLSLLPSLPSNPLLVANPSRGRRRAAPSAADLDAQLDAYRPSGDVAME